MQVRVFVSPLRGFIRPTGVIRHAIEMLVELAHRADEVDVSLIANRRVYDALGQSLPSVVRQVRKYWYPGAERMNRYALLMTPLYSADRSLSSHDWVYAPRLHPVMCNRAKLAVTVHDTLAFESAETTGVRPAWSRIAKERHLLKRAARQADLICVVSEYLKRRIKEVHSGLPDELFQVVGNGASDLFFEPIASSDDDVLRKYNLYQRPYVLVTGDLIYRKGGDITVGVAEILASKSMECIVAVTGSKIEPCCLGDQFPKSHMRLLGYVNHRELAVLYRHSSALLLPSRIESFGMSACEAMAAGTPVVYAKKAALPEVVGEAGIGISGNCPKEATEALAALLNQSPEREKLIRMGRARANRFKWQFCSQRLLDAMKERA